MPLAHNLLSIPPGARRPLPHAQPLPPNRHGADAGLGRPAGRLRADARRQPAPDTKAAEPAKTTKAEPPARPASAAAAPFRPASAAMAAAPASPPGGPPPFATVIKDARRIDGPLVLWQKDEKVWIELQPAQLGQPFLLSPKIKNGVSEAWVLGGLMAQPINGAGGAQVVEFVRVHNQVRLQARNTDVMAKAGTPRRARWRLPTPTACSARCRW